MKLDAEEIGPCHGSAVKDAYLSCRQIPFHMGAKAGIHMDMMVPEVTEHGSNSSLSHFLGFLKHKNHLSFPLRFMERKDFGLCQQHGHMSVVAAGMHDAIVFGNAHPFLRQVHRIFLNRKGINVCPHEHRPARPAAVNKSEYPAMGHPYCFNS